MNNNYYQSPKSNWIKRLFWRACGADRILLEKSTYSDQIKYFCLGGIVVATGCMAAMAGGYAFYTIFEPKGDALNTMLTDSALKNGVSAKDLIHWPTVFKSSIFGIIWGLIIYNIDRFIVTSTGKGDGTEAITAQEIKSAVPRLIMGMIIALTISKPVEIRMFKSEIDAEIYAMQQEEKIRLQGIIDEQFDKRLDKEKEYIDKLELEIREKEERYVELENTFNAETGGERGSSGYGPEAKKIEEQMKRLDSELTRIKNKNEVIIDSSYAKIEKFDKEKLERYADAENQANAMDGLLLRLQLAHEKAGWLISLFITLLFMVIELTPIFFKMMLIKGPYDYMDENIKELARAELGIEIEYDFYTDKEGIDKHKVTNHGAQVLKRQKIASLKAQDELNQEIIKKWKEQELKKINENPEDYIQ